MSGIATAASNSANGFITSILASRCRSLAQVYNHRRLRGPMPVRQSLLIVILGVFPLSAQWVNYPTPGVPKTAAGAPNLNAPAPRLANGKPDFSGVWQPEKTRPCPPEGCDDMQVGEEFLNIGWSVKGGLPYQPWAAEQVKTRKARNGQDDPGTHCLPTGIMMMHTTPLFRKIVHTP